MGQEREGELGKKKEEEEGEEEEEEEHEAAKGGWERLEVEVRF